MKCREILLGACGNTPETPREHCPDLSDIRHRSAIEYINPPPSHLVHGRLTNYLQWHAYLSTQSCVLCEEAFIRNLPSMFAHNDLERVH